MAHNNSKVNAVSHPPESPARVDRVGDSLPCLNSNNYIEDSQLREKLTPYHRKQAYSLIQNCDQFIDSVGINHVGFLTLTFPDNVLEHKEALNRWNSLRTNFLSKVFGKWMLVKERQKRGAIHYHILIECPYDIRTGFDFDEVFPKGRKRPNYRSANRWLKALWSALREAMPKYGFGRSELAPIRSNGEAMAKYVGKYISKNQKARKKSKYDELDKGSRMIAYSQNWARSNTKFAWHSDGSREWRRKVKVFANIMGCSDLYELKKKFGPKWAYNYGPAIMEIDEVVKRHLKEVPF